MMNENNIQNKETINSINDYKQKYNLYNSHLKKYLGSIEERNTDYEKKLYDKIVEKGLDARKSYYETNETENIKKYSSFFTIIYYLFFAIYLVLFIINGEFLKPIKIIYLCIYLLFPFIWFFFILKNISHIINYLYNNTPKNVYFNM